MVKKNLKIFSADGDISLVLLNLFDSMKIFLNNTQLRVGNVIASGLVWPRAGCSGGGGGEEVKPLIFSD